MNILFRSFSFPSFWLASCFPNCYCHHKPTVMLNQLPLIVLDMLPRGKAICSKGALSQNKSRQALGLTGCFQGTARQVKYDRSFGDEICMVFQTILSLPVAASLLAFTAAVILRLFQGFCEAGQMEQEIKQNKMTQSSLCISGSSCFP